ncbi:hypothetical protein B0H67DRAFT_493480 [Lasiosphaeris hirsuta]|uniref:RING-type E3 ubiquitin transferase n=1 Tax=Lasiosphaeris hirsuta TaxID=260670 RepID=A0AA40AA19_9PEZI|nr:hypothetical protein B0H67DRAFT_493480 [Lasiosphaeris hirsuta]
MGEDTEIDPFDPIRFPNTRLRTTTDETSRSHDASMALDPDTCRICRGEGTSEEPLFYPCKCSGSIKYVHQDCLMEWLSHSQKKHCELCKTPFRFTKLYAPDMPNALPFHIFISHMAKYLFRNLLVWLRGALVASVWLGWLPYLMRSVWSFLFWISDEGLGGRISLFARLNNTGLVGSVVSVLPYATTCPSSPLFAATTTVATVGGVMDGLPADSIQLVKGWYKINLTATDPKLYSTILRLLLSSVGLDKKSAAKIVPLTKSHPSLLSDVGFLRNLTRHAYINRTVIAIFEGQIITILVIVCFILIILVRDYVVQQQPDLMRAGFAPMENAAPQPPLEDPGVRPEEVEHLAGPGEAHAEEYDKDAAQLLQDLEGLNNDSAGPDDAGPSFLGRHPSDSAESTSELALPSFLNETPPFLESERPRRDITAGENATVHEYLTIYRKAGGDPEKILKIAQDLGMEHKLEYWIRLTRLKMDRDRRADDNSLASGELAESTAGMSTAAQVGTSGASRGSDQSSDWVWSDEQQQPWNSDKGKGKLPEDDVEKDFPEMIGSPLRPRANTDGPMINNTFNPLANNSWSFTGLGDEPSSASEPQGEPRVNTLHFPESQPAEQGFNPTFQPDARPSSNTDDVERYLAPAAFDAFLQNPDVVQAGPDHDHTEAQPPRHEQPEAGAAQPRLATDAQPPRRQTAGFLNSVADFMWGDIDDIDPAELAAVDLLDDFGDNDDFAADQDMLLMDAADREREAAEAEAAIAAGLDPAGLDPEAIDDAEDLEGILELLGMRGPVAGLFQNAIFCAFLVSITIFLGIFVPYNIGRITVWTVANPMRPAQMLFSLSKFIQDCALIVAGLASCTMSYAIEAAGRLANVSPVADYFSPATASSWSMARNAANRITTSFMSEMPIISPSEVRNFSAISHEALHVIQGHTRQAFYAAGQLIMFIFGGDYPAKGTEAFDIATNVFSIVWEGLKGVPEILTNPGSWVINLSVPETAAAVNPELAYWNGVDRFWAIASGYVAMSMMAGLYLRRGTPFSSSQTGQEWEATLIDGLNQASGVMKVILIIGIEMLVFPLYCGMLLDIALLPLFEQTSIKSRIIFTANFPVTSIFVHWFVGTGYMFHFALFVSMCRKIMRKGVLYFIRDPDDPEFHPVRDVLERSVTTQLRKILFSAFVYGALVIVCLGGVVWGLALALPNVLPIHYSSNEPVLEFPIDLLFYNFLMPLAVKFFRPSDGLHAMYTWWFRKCARALRITWFLFGERRVDEEGHLALKDGSPYKKAPWWKTLFLELAATGEVVPKTWSDTFEGGMAKPNSTIPTDEMITMNVTKIYLVKTEQLLPDGRFVRTPASDQVKIPKGQRVFMEVHESNMRKDKEPDRPETDIYSTNQYQFVYVPPHFRARVFLFILFIWLFAAATGVGITIVPLVFGRQMFKLLIPGHIRTNDIYAFSIGVYVLSSATYMLVHLRATYESLKLWTSTAAMAAYNRGAVRRVVGVASRVAKVAYAYLVLFVLFPLMVASLMELYAVIPLHEFMYSGLIVGNAGASESGDKATQLNPSHTIRVIQGWTVGLLYLKLSTRIVVTWFDNTRLASAVRAVLRRGWLDPDLAVLTRAFVIPGMALWTTAVAAPLLFARFTISHGLAEAIVNSAGTVLADGMASEELYRAYLVLIYRLSFPFMALGVVTCFTLWSMIGVFRSWRVRIRDEAYLIGERLHNFGVVNGPPRARGAWRAGGSRL